MNRQFRRAQEKQDKKQQKEKTRRREERKAKVRQARQSRKEKSDKKHVGENRQETGEGKPAAPASRGRVPGRFSGVLAAVTVFFITLQGAGPEPEQGEAWWASLVYPGFFLMLGYFATLWFMRRDTGRAPVVSVVGGTLLGISVAVAQVVQGRELDLLSHALVIPALVAGALLGRLVFVATPR